MLLLWFSLPLVHGWQFWDPNEVFSQKSRQGVDLFHHTLFIPDSFPLASQIFQETANSKSNEKLKGDTATEGGGATHGGKSEKEKSTTHTEEAQNKGKSDNESSVKKYGEESKKEGITQSGDDEEHEHHTSSGGENKGGYKDRLLHKTGNYEKGYRDRYHLDEILKKEKFWSSHHSLDQFHKYGQSGSHYDKKHHADLKKGKHTAGEENDKHGKKGESGKGHSESEDKGHKSKAGAHSMYENKEKYHKEENL